MKIIKPIIVSGVAALIFSPVIANQTSSDNITLNVKIYDGYDYASSWKDGDFEIKVLDMTSDNEVGFTQATKNFNIGLARDKRYLIYVSRSGYVTKFIEISTEGVNMEFKHVFFLDMVLMKRSEIAANEMNYPSAIITCGLDSDGEFEIQDIGTSVRYLRTALSLGASNL